MATLRTVLIMASVGLFCVSAATADRIVLRNLDVISDKTVERLDEDGVRLNDGTVIGWDRIEQGRVAAASQAEFDQFLKDLGEHLYRIRQRLSIGDYRDVLPHAEAVYPRYRGRRSETAYMVCQAMMWSRLDAGQREASLAPYLDCLETLRQAAGAQRELSLPGERRLEADLRTGLSPDLPPVWFDAEAARAALPDVGRSIAAMAEPRPPAARIYYATLALAAGEADQAAQALAGLEELPELKAIVAAQLQLLRGETGAAVAALQSSLGQLPDQLQPLGLYWMGQARLAAPDSDTRTAGLLDLLRIAALFGKDQPELAAAGLYAAMRVLAESGDATGSIATRRELLDHYGQTWHARLLRHEDRKARKTP